MNIKGFAGSTLTWVTLKEKYEKLEKFNKNKENNKKLVLIIPGLTGGTESTYISN